jgi:hypothetical protein
MLRASVEIEGTEVDYRGIADGQSAEASSVLGAGALVGLVEATLSGSGDDGHEARARVRSELGAEALVDAAAIIGNFERMTRIADATGIPLDAPVNVATETLRVELGIDRFGSAANTNAVKPWQRMLGRTLDPVARTALRWIGRRARSRAELQPEE